MILEAWNDTVKHAHAQTIATTIRQHSEVLTATAVDDGSGFDSSASHPGHLGLRTMRERALMMGAELDISSSDIGTTVQITLPCPSPATGGGAVPDITERQST